MFRYYLIIFLNVSIVFFCCGSSTESFEIEEEVSYINFIEYPDSLHLFVFNVGQGNFCMIKKGWECSHYRCRFSQCATPGYCSIWKHSKYFWIMSKWNKGSSSDYYTRRWRSLQFFKFFGAVYGSCLFFCCRRN